MLESLQTLDKFKPKLKEFIDLIKTISLKFFSLLATRFAQMA